MLASDQPNDKRTTTSSHRGDDNDANTGGTVGATTSATSRRCHVRDENGDGKTHLNRGFGHDTTHDTTRSDRRGGRRRAARRADGGPAGVPACARAVFVNARVQFGSIFLLRRRRRGFSRRLSLDRASGRRKKLTSRPNRPPRDVRLVALGCSCVRNTNTHARTTPNAQKTYK